MPVSKLTAQHALDKLKMDFFNHDVFLTENGFRDLLKELTVRNGKLSYFDTVVAICGPRLVGGSYQGIKPCPSFSERYALLSKEQRKELKDFYLGHVREAKQRFRSLESDFPLQFDS